MSTAADLDRGPGAGAGTVAGPAVAARSVRRRVSPVQGRRWQGEGRTLLIKACRGIAARRTDLTAPTALPGWSRAHVLSHLACGAEALGRLASWADTGVEQRMYASPQQRAADIEAGAALPPAELLGRVRTTAVALDVALAALPAAAWQTEVVTAQGRTVRFDEVPWMRAREMLVHAVDLDVGLTFADLPTGFCHDLLDEVTDRMSAAGAPALLLLAPGAGTWTLAGPEPATSVIGSLADLTRWVTGRGTGTLRTVGGRPLPELPRWI